MSAACVHETDRLLHDCLAAMSRSDFTLTLPPFDESDARRRPGVLVPQPMPMLQIGGVNAPVLAHLLAARLAELEAARTENARMRAAMRALANVAMKAAE